MILSSNPPRKNSGESGGKNLFVIDTSSKTRRRKKLWRGKKETVQTLRKISRLSLEIRVPLFPIVLRELHAKPTASFDPPKWQNAKGAGLRE